MVKLSSAGGVSLAYDKLKRVSRLQGIHWGISNVQFGCCGGLYGNKKSDTCAYNLPAGSLVFIVDGGNLLCEQCARAQGFTPMCPDCESERCDCNESIWNCSYKNKRSGTVGNYGYHATLSEVKDRVAKCLARRTDYEFSHYFRKSEPIYNFDCTIDEWKAKVRGKKSDATGKLPAMRAEAPCQVCGRMNDIGVAKCWNCENKP